MTLLQVYKQLSSKETTHFQHCFHSENYIFGKFDAFCKRLEKINDMLNTMETFAGVNNIKIEVCSVSILLAKVNWMTLWA